MSQAPRLPPGNGRTVGRDTPAFAVIVPAYREAGRIGAVVQAIAALGAPILVVDDGSDDATAGEAERAGARVLLHPVNRGKGVALNTGFADALARGLDFVITMDADGQHDPADIPAFVETHRSTNLPVLIGNRMDRPAGMPLVRRWTNRFMSALLSREMGQRVPDTQCGFRLYAREALALMSSGSERFAAESEVLLTLAGRGLRIGSVPIRVIYGNEKSKIRPVRDTIRFFAMLHRYRRRGKRAPVSSEGRRRPC